MSEATTTLDVASGGVKISWIQPDDNGDTITSYLIEIKDSLSGWNTELTDCDGSDGTIITNLYCIVPMTTLTSAPFTLSLDDLVEVRILATNSVGNGLVSDPNTSGALVRTVPSAMPTPTLVALTSSSV